MGIKPNGSADDYTYIVQAIPILTLSKEQAIAEGSSAMLGSTCSLFGSKSILVYEQANIRMCGVVPLALCTECKPCEAKDLRRGAGQLRFDDSRGAVCCSLGVGLHKACCIGRKIFTPNLLIDKAKLRRSI